MINASTKLCCLIGNPVSHSLSPAMHNAGYKALGLNYSYLAFNVKDVKDVLAGLKALGVRGISVTVPHKQTVMQYVDEIDETAQEIGAVNTIVNDNGILKATNTDWLGAMDALEEKTRLKGKTVALIGAGGAARAIVYGLKKRGALVTVFNRTPKKAHQLAEDFGLSASHPLTAIDKLASNHIIINATSSPSPIPKNIIEPRHVVFDITYASARAQDLVPLQSNTNETQLIHNARITGATIVTGDTMLLYQGIRQFELFTGNKAPIEMMRSVLNQEA